MNISISSIAWDTDLDASVANVMSGFDIHHVDLTPTRYFKDLYNVTKADVLRVKSWWNNRGIDIYGMQSLLFGKNDFNIFNVVKQKDIFSYLERVFYVASLLGVKRLVFGSPRNRDRSAFSDTETFDISTTFFYRIGEMKINAKIGRINEYCAWHRIFVYQVLDSGLYPLRYCQRCLEIV